VSRLVAVFVATTAARARAVAALIAAVADGAGAAAAAATGMASVQLVETRVTRAARAATAFTEMGGEAAPTAAAAAAARETGQLIASRVTVRVPGRSVAAGRETGFSALPLATAVRGRRRRERFLEVAGQHLVHKSERHSRVSRSSAMDGSPS
jgi:hypothetical protein